MNDGMTAKQYDIVLLLYPFSDLTGAKRRPVIVLSNTNHNNTHQDIICCPLTSNPRNPDSIAINSQDVNEGKLKYDSWAKPKNVFTAHKRMIIKHVAHLRKEQAKTIYDSINAVLEPEFAST
jgi:mRNA interferase MazF